MHELYGDEFTPPLPLPPCHRDASDPARLLNAEHPRRAEFVELMNQRYSTGDTGVTPATAAQRKQKEAPAAALDRAAGSARGARAGASDGEATTTASVTGREDDSSVEAEGPTLLPDSDAGIAAASSPPGALSQPHAVACLPLAQCEELLSLSQGNLDRAVEDHLSSSGDKGAAGERAARERVAGTERAARERAATVARAAGISIPSGVVVKHARPLRRKQRGVDEDALEEAISRGAMPRELPTVNPRLNVKSIKQGNEFYLRSAQDSVVHITVVRHGVNTGQDVKIVETRAYSRLELQREIFELERHVDELLRPTVRSFTSPDLALK